MESEFPDDMTFYSVKEVAKMLDVNAETVKRWLRMEGPERLNAIKVGGYWRVSKQDLREFISSHRV